LLLIAQPPGGPVFLLENAAPDAGADLVFSASDLVSAAECEYRVLRILDEKLGRTPPAAFAADEMLQRAASLGDVHEHRVLEKFTAELGTYSPGNPGGVYEVVPAATMDRATLTAKHEESLEALRAGAGVVFQASFFDGVFHGRSDFLVHTGDGYAVWDTKLARHAKVGAACSLRRPAAAGRAHSGTAGDPRPRGQHLKRPQPRRPHPGLPGTPGTVPEPPGGAPRPTRPRRMGRPRP
jgi:uncharacterized protein